MSGGNRNKDHRKLATGLACGGILLAGLAAGSHWHRAAKTGIASPLSATFVSNALAARPSSVPAADPLATFRLAQQSLAIPHPVKRTPAPKSPASELPAAAAFSPTISPVARARAVETYSALPMMFEANSGQTDPRVKFLAHAPGYVLYLTGQEAVLSLQQPSAQTGSRAGTAPVLHSRAPQPQKAARAVRLGFVGSNPAAVVAGRELLPAKSNYFTGNDPKQWHTNVPNYAAVEYRQIYPGVDAVFHGDNRRLEFDFDIAPGADPHTIALEVDGARQIRLDRAGDLLLRMHATRDLVMAKPRIYQRSPEGRHEIAGHYVLGARNRIAFALGPYDRTQPLVIDPTVEYATYLGGSGSDYAEGIAVDSSGNAYVTGNTSSTNFPTMDPYESAGTAFVSKLNPTGSALVYSTYLSGAGAYAIAVDSAGNAYVTGSAQSGLPTMNAYQATSHGTLYNAFVTKLDAAGSALIYSTYLGGDYADEGFGIAVDSSGSAYVTGLTNSAGFPTVNPIQATCNDCAGSTGDLFDGDAFVTKFSPDGSSLVYSTYLGGSAQDWGQSITVDSSGSAYVTGLTQSTNFPTANAFQPANASTLLATTGESAFVSKLNPSGSALVYSTYLGGSAEDYGSGIAVDSAGSAYVTGFAQSHNFPTMNPYQATMRGANNAFVSKFNADGSALVYSTYLGGASATQGNSIAVDPFGNAYVTGSTTSNNFPLVDATQTSCLGCSSYSSAFVAQFNATGSALLFSTYLGGSKSTVGYGIAVDPSGDAHVAGLTESTNFPTVAPFQATNKSASETAFVAMYSFPPETALTLSPTTISSGMIDVAYSPVTITATGATGTVTFAITSGSLPSGITLTTAGVLSGTPTQIGTYPFTVTAADTSGDSGSQGYSLQIACQTITVGPSTLAPGTAGAPYGPVTFTETGGVGTTTFSESGALPSGVTFSAPVLSGTTTQSGNFPITVTATDSNSCSGNITDTLTINSSTTAPVSVTDNETITVTDTETFPDVPDSETITVTDGVTVTPLISITAPVASFSTSSLGFGNVAAGTSGTQTITVSNVGIGQTGLLLSSATIPSGTPFSIGTISCANGASSFSTTLPSGGACQVPISYAAPASGTPPSATITFTDNAALSNLTSTLSGSSYTQTILLNGAGTPTPQPTEPLATIPVSDSETITVTDTETFPDVADSETITVSDQVNVTVNQISQTITFPTIPTPTYGGGPVTLNATASSSLPVSYTVTSGPATVGGNILTIIGAGSVTVQASQAGNANYSAATPVSQTFTVNQASQTIAFTTPAPATAKSGDSFTVAATGGASGNPVTFSVGTGSVCTLSGATYTMTADTGTCSVIANQAGNSNYAAAPQVTETVTAVKKVTKVLPTVTFTGAPSSATYLSTFAVETTQNSGIAPTITSTTGSVCTVSGGIVGMKSGTGTCTVKASWATNDYYLATSLTQSTNATMLGTSTAITSTTTLTPKNVLKVTVYFTVSNGTSTAVKGNVTVTASSGQTCTGTVTAGKCLLTFTALDAGPQTLTAVYAGNTDDSTSTSASYPLRVN
jgi:hypothetical protein